jgi:predicted benzoate:H+ symporter BenE
MKLPDVILLALAIVFLVIGIDQIITLGFTHAYWAIMLGLIFFFVYNLRRRKKR